MRLRVLGCSGGIGGRHLRTTSFLIDHDILLDAGTGVGDLSLAELSLIDHIYLTHSHLDHIASIPFLVDTVGGMRTGGPLTVHATRETIEILKNHMFNWTIWPDFTQVPTPEAPFMRYAEIELGRSETLDGRTITPLPAVHTVPAVGFQLDSGENSLVFSGDTGCNDALWKAVNRIENLRTVFIETAFSNRDKKLAELSKHLCPETLAIELAKLERSADIYVTHLKPGEIELTMEEIEAVAGDYRPRMLQNNQVFDF